MTDALIIIGTLALAVAAAGFVAWDLARIAHRRMDWEADNGRD